MINSYIIKSLFVIGLSLLFFSSANACSNGDREMRFYACKNLAEKGNIEGQVKLAIKYKYGFGTAKDANKAFYWFEKSAEAGHPEAQYYLGQAYDSGEGVLTNYDKSYYWYLKSASQGYAIAQTVIGMRFADGTHVKADDKEAIKLFLKAAKQNDEFAQARLSNMYSFGFGVDRNLVLAHMWNNLAIYNGHKKSKILTPIIEESMSVLEIKKAQQLAQEWLIKNN